MMMKKHHLFNHVLIVAEDNSSVTYVENYISTVDCTKAMYLIIVTEVLQMRMQKFNMVLLIILQKELQLM